MIRICGFYRLCVGRERTVLACTMHNLCVCVFCVCLDKVKKIVKSPGGVRARIFKYHLDWRELVLFST
jgi:hypothetical protein